MVWTVRYSKTASKVMARLPRPLAERIRAKVDELSRNPSAPHLDVVKLKGRDGFRLRIGDYRVIYVLRDKEMIVLVLQIGARGNVYVQDSDDRDQWRKGGGTAGRHLRTTA